MNKVSFFDHEVKAILNEFPTKAAPLHGDLSEIELDAIDSFGKVKTKFYSYLGNPAIC